MVNHPNRSKAKLPDGLIHEILDNDGQSRRFKRLIRVDGKVFRTSVRLDTSSPHQSTAELAVYFPETGFAVLLALSGYEVRACREYHHAPAVGRQEKVQGWLFDTDSHLLEIGRQIVREGST